MLVDWRRLADGLVGEAMGSGRPDRLNRRLDFDLAGPLEHEGQLEEIAFLERPREIHQHHMVAAWFQYERSAGPKGDGIDTAHFGNAVL